MKNAGRSRQSFLRKSDGRGIYRTRYNFSHFFHRLHNFYSSYYSLLHCSFHYSSNIYFICLVMYLICHSHLIRFILFRYFFFISFPSSLSLQFSSFPLSSFLLPSLFSLILFCPFSPNLLYYYYHYYYHYYIYYYYYHLSYNYFQYHYYN